jgi:hypothetical protein
MLGIGCLDMGTFDNPGHSFLLKTETASAVGGEQKMINHENWNAQRRCCAA